MTDGLRWFAKLFSFNFAKKTWRRSLHWSLYSDSLPSYRVSNSIQKPPVPKVNLIRNPCPHSYEHPQTKPWWMLGCTLIYAYLGLTIIGFDIGGRACSLDYYLHLFSGMYPPTPDTYFPDGMNPGPIPNCMVRWPQPIYNVLTKAWNM